MKAFWWFRENAVAGMARPGFNSCRWFDLPFDEAIVMGWLGQYSGGPLSLDSFQSHLKVYLPRVLPFYQGVEQNLESHLSEYGDSRKLESMLGRLAERSRFLSNVSLSETTLHFDLNQQQLESEISFLKSQGIQRIVSLTETHHIVGGLQDHFHLDHISIVDMTAPTVDQAMALAEILEKTERAGERVAVHCLAGIGRTSTMLIASEILKKQRPLDEVVSLTQKQNPYFSFKGPQADFLRSLEQKKSQVQVVAAVIQDGPRFLLGKRSVSKKSAPGSWSPICGRIEPGEDQKSAIERECREEVGLNVEAQKKVAEFEVDLGATRIHWWLVDRKSGEATLLNDEHTELRWFSIEDMKSEPGFALEYLSVFENILSSQR